MSTAPDRLHEVIEPEVTALGMDLEDVSVTGPAKHRVLKVAVDKTGGLSIDDIADASRELSKALDRVDVLGSAPYTLEVTSRGIDQPLTLPRHWRRNIGRLVQVPTRDSQQIAGRIRNSDETGADLEVKGAHRRIEYADVSRAQIQVELNRKDA